MASPRLRRGKANIVVVAEDVTYAAFGSRLLIVGAVLVVGAGVAFASTHNFCFLVLAGIIGVISPSGNEVGPFLSIEQAALSSDDVRGALPTWSEREKPRHACSSPPSGSSRSSTGTPTA